VGKQMKRKRWGREEERTEGRRFKRVAMKSGRRGSVRGEGKVNSVKYPQLDATHWHTVSMQILFTLGSPPPVLLLSLYIYMYIYMYIHIYISFSPSHHHDSRRVPLILRSPFAPMESDAMRDARVHPPFAPRIHTPCSPSPVFRTLPRNLVIPLFISISSFSFTYNKYFEAKSMLQIYFSRIATIDLFNNAFSATIKKKDYKN